MKTLKEYLEKQINEQLRQVVLSGKRKGEGPSLIKVRPVEIKGHILYQASSTEGTQIFHKNYEREEMLSFLEKEITENFTQLQGQGEILDGTVLVSKKGKITVKAKNHPVKEKVKIQAHNRVKRYILKEGIPVPFLIDLGVMTKTGQIVSQRYDKFRQINRFLEFIEDILPRLSREREVTILDFGCGKSYLTFAMYYYLHFYQGDIAQYEGVSSVDMVVTLHACDTATDYALFKAVEWGAEVILSVPCCQHEVNRQIKNEMLSPVLKYGILKERMSALITDGVRANLLEVMGYDTQILEFVDMEHTPKNLLIRGVKTGRKKSREEVTEMMRQLQIRPSLERLLFAEENQDKEKQDKGE